MEYINLRIKQEICYKTLEELTDTNLLEEYKECISVKNEIKKLDEILIKYISDETKQKIIQEYLINLIPAGTKGVIRGNKFNKIVKTVLRAVDTEETTSTAFPALVSPFALSSFKEEAILSKIGFSPP